jgi:hypothetical protein
VYDERRTAQPEVIRVISSSDGRYVEAPVDRRYAGVPGAAPYQWRIDAVPQNGGYHDAHPVEYDPNRPLLDVRQRASHNTAPSSRTASPTQLGWRQREQIPSENAHHPAQPMVQYTYPVPGAYPVSPPAAATPSHAVQQPVHGAPALVQQMPRELAKPRHAPLARYDPAAATPQRQPVYGVPQHAQYYPR